MAATLAAIAASTLVVAPGHVGAQPAAGAATATATLNIPAQPLPLALAEFARQSGLQLVYAPDLVQGKQSTSVVGGKDAAAALADLLRGTGLQARQLGSTWAIERAPATQSAAETVLPVVRVSASQERETATGSVNGYVARRSATGTKTDTAIVETPQSISVIAADQIQTTKSQNLMDALGYTASVARAEGLDRTSDSFVIRGFRANAGTGSLFRDGSKYQLNIYNGQQEPYGLERIELLKGASSVLYGTAAPGGVINTVSKRPTIEPLREINVEWGSFGRKQVSGDFAGALGQDSDWSYRLTAMHRDSGTFVDHVPDDRTYVAPALKWQPNAATSLTLLSEYQHDRSAYVYGLPESGTLTSNPKGQIPRNVFTGEPGYSEYDNARYSVGYLFEHAFDDRLKLRHSLRYLKSSNDFPSISLGDLDTDGRTISRDAQDRQDDSNGLTTDTSLSWSWGRSGLEQTTLVGLDYTAQTHQTVRYNRSVSSLDLFNPVYGQAVFGTPVLAGNSSKEKVKQLGLYAQHQMKIDERWVLLLGGREDKVKDDYADYPVEFYYPTEKTSAFTGRAGVVYLAPDGLAPYASFSQSFEPAWGSNLSGTRFKPTKGEQVEAGLRYRPPGWDVQFSTAVYQLTQKNLLVSDATGNDAVQIGQARSRGFELEAQGHVGRDTRALAACAYTDARVTRSSELTPQQVGSRLGGVPYNQLSLWVDHSLAAVGLAELKFGAGARHVGATRATSTAIISNVPAFTLLDLMVSYTVGPWRFALNATNATDKTYVASCTYGCFYGEPRKVTATATVRW